MRDKSAAAQDYFESGCNCAQSVLAAFCDEAGVSQTQAERLAWGLGGGMGKLGEVCGAVSAAFMALGGAAEGDDTRDKEQRMALYARVRAFAQTFEEKNGSILCRELMKNARDNAGSAQCEEKREFYLARPCRKYVDDAVEILSEMLAAADEA